MVKTGAAAEAAAPEAAASVLISCFIFILYFGFSFDLIFASFFFANTGVTRPTRQSVQAKHPLPYLAPVFCRWQRVYES